MSRDSDKGGGALENGEQSSIAEPEDDFEESSSVQVDQVGHMNGSEQTDSDDVKVPEDVGNEDMFLDAADELSSNDGRNIEAGKRITISDNCEILAEEHNRFRESHSTDDVERLRSMLEKAVAEKEVLIWENKEQERSYAEKLSILHHELKGLTNRQLSTGKNDGGSLGDLHEEETGMGEIPLNEMINRCSESLKTATETQLQNEYLIKELHETLNAKDKEIENLIAKVTEHSLGQDVIASSLQSTSSHPLEVSADVQVEKDQQIGAALSNTLAALSMVVYQEELLDDSTAAKVSLVESSVYGLIQNYNWFLSEIEQLRQCWNEVGSDNRVQEDFGAIFIAVKDELCGLRKKESDLIEKLAQLEGENGKLTEKLVKEKEIVESVNTELSKVKLELEQEKARSANVKEKLSMAVTKGKALVQQRDSLKLSLAEKTKELEKCLEELQEKSGALEASAVTKEELVKSENLVASLQEDLSQRDMILGSFEEILSQTSVPDKLQSADIPGKIKWLVDDRNALESVSLEFLKLKNALFADLPETVLSLDLESRVGWLRESLFSAKDQASAMHAEISRMKESAKTEIDTLTFSLLAEIQEKEYLQRELDDYKCKLQEVVQKEQQSSLEKNEIIRILMSASGITLSDQEEVHQLYTSMPKLVERCLEKMAEQKNTSSESSCAQEEIFERALTFLYLRDQELMLCEKLLEEETLERSEVSKRLNEELALVKHEKDTLHSDLLRAEEKTALVKEKLSMAVKKGKGLVQDRENLKSLLVEKNKEIESFKLELQQQEFALSECRDRIHVLSIDVERIPELEATLVSVKDQKCQIEKILMEIDTMLQRIVQLIDGVLLVDSVAENPEGKVKWLWENLKGILDGKDKEIKKLEFKLQQQESVLSDFKNQTSRLSNDMERIPSLEASVAFINDQKDQLEKVLMAVNDMLLSIIESIDGVSLPLGHVIDEPVEKVKWIWEKLTGLVDEKTKLKLELQQQECTLNDYREQMSRLSSYIESIPKLEADLVSVKDQKIQVEKTLKDINSFLLRIESVDGVIIPDDYTIGEHVEELSLLIGYYNKCQVAKTQAEEELDKVKEQVNGLSTKLVEAQTTIRSLEDAVLVGENNLSQLADEKRELELGKTFIEQALQKAEEEAKCHNSSLAEAKAGRAVAVAELNKVQEEVSVKTSKLTEAYETIRSLEDTLVQLETNISLLNEENNKAQVGRSNLENELKKLKDELNSQAGDLVDARSTIKALEDVAMEAENSTSLLLGQKKEAEEEISTLNSKLTACMEELSGTNGSMDNRSIELFGYLNDFQVLAKDGTLMSLLREGCNANYERLKSMDFVLGNIQNCCKFARESQHGSEENLFVADFLTDVPDYVSVEKENGELSMVHGNDVAAQFGKAVKELRSRDKILGDRIEGFSTSMDAVIGALLEKAQAVNNEVIGILEHMVSLKHEMKIMETDKQVLKDTLATLENNLATTISSCSDATKELDLESKNVLLQLDSGFEIEKLDQELNLGLRENEIDAAAANHQKDSSGDYVKAAENFSIATRNAQTLIKQFANTKSGLDATIDALQHELKVTRTSLEDCIKEKDLYQNKVLELKSELESSQSICSKLRLQLEDWQERENKLKERLYGCTKEKELNQSHVFKLGVDLESSQSLCSELKLQLEDCQARENNLKERVEECTKERDLNQSKVFKLEVDLESSQSLCNELKLQLEDCQARENNLKERVEECTKERDLNQSKVFKLEVDLESSQSLCSELRLQLEDCQARENKLNERAEECRKERDANQIKVSKLETDLESSKSACGELRLELEAYQSNENILNKRAREEPGAGDILSPLQMRYLFDKISEIKISFAEGDKEIHGSNLLKKLFHIIDSFNELHEQNNTLSHDKKELKSLVERHSSEIERLTEEVDREATCKKDSEEMRSEFSDLLLHLEKIVLKLGGNEASGKQNPGEVKKLLSALDKLVTDLNLESESSKSKVQELGTMLLGSQKAAEELSTKVKSLEQLLQSRTVSPTDVVEERRIFEGPLLPSGSEITEIEDAGSVGKNAPPPALLAAQMRTLRKGSTDHLALNIDSESDRLIDGEKEDEDKGHIFKSLNTSGLIPKQAKTIADRVDGIWVSGGRVLMSRPRARIGVIAYCLLLHMWLLATIL